jgi:hypothetical protein
MRVVNVHERALQVPADRAGALIDSLSSADDKLWPRHAWPRMKFDRPLGVGASGGHGPIRYVVEAYAPGRSIRFRFTGPSGFNGHHGCDAIPTGPESCILRHSLEMTTSGLATITWPVAFRPLHDALVEDALALGQASLGQAPQAPRWSPWVRALRWLMSGGKAPSQRFAERT